MDTIYEEACMKTVDLLVEVKKALDEMVANSNEVLKVKHGKDMNTYEIQLIYRGFSPSWEITTKEVFEKCRTIEVLKNADIWEEINALLEYKLGNILI